MSCAHKDEKVVKRKKRKLNEDKGVMNALNKLQCTLEKQVNVNMMNLEMKIEKDRKEFELRKQVVKKEIELKEKAQRLRERAQMRQEQERIMNQDLNKLSPTVRASYEILKKWEIEGLFGNNMFRDLLISLSDWVEKCKSLYEEKL
ncbi:glutathione S-transferase T2-like [Forsythia ovata]|uniref:Glutathione S-transferase T2-like n=1 Tax=Forsythia ovata TaxID=205694 RepID=A0ABD1WXA4_9LAMI